MKWFVLVFALMAAPAFAQESVVASVSADLRARGVDLSGPCGAFAITSRVAWTLRGAGAGVLDKPTGNQCAGRAVDIIVFPDGHAFDILTDAGGSNGPSWNPIAPVDASRWRAAADPGDGGASLPPTPTPLPTPSIPSPSPSVPSLDLSPILARLSEIYDQNERIYLDSNNRRDAQTTQILAAVNEPAWYHKLVANPYFQAIVASVGTWAITRQAMK